MAKLFKNRYLWNYQSYSPHFGFYTPIFGPTVLKNTTFKQLNISGVSKMVLVALKRVNIVNNLPICSQIDISGPIRATIPILGSTLPLLNPLS